MACFFVTPQQLKRIDPPSLLTINRCCIDICKKLKTLGVTLDSTLNFEAHINSVDQSCNYHIRSLRKIHRLLTRDVANTMECSNAHEARQLHLDPVWCCWDYRISWCVSSMTSELMSTIFSSCCQSTVGLHSSLAHCASMPYRSHSQHISLTHLTFTCLRIRCVHPTEACRKFWDKKNRDWITEIFSCSSVSLELVTVYGSKLWQCGSLLNLIWRFTRSTSISKVTNPK